MKLSSKKLLFALGVLTLACHPLFGEPRHDSGTGDTFNLSRPSSGSSSAKKLSDLVNSCFAGRGGSGSTLGINPGLGQVGQGIGSGTTGNKWPNTQVDDTTRPRGNGGSVTAGLMPAQCLKCHSRAPKGTDESISMLSGGITPPKEMEQFLAGLSAGEKSEMIAFFQKRKSEGR